MRSKVVVVGSGPLVRRGVESYLLNLYKYIDHRIISMDFLTPFSCKNDKFFEVTKKNDDSVVELKIECNKISFIYKFYRELYFYLKKNKYDIIYINTGNILPMSIALYAAFKANIRHRIVHSHNGGINSIRNRLLKFLFTPILKYFPTKYFACSKLAADFVFPKKKVLDTIIVPNGIEINKFKYNDAYRKRIRLENNLDSCVVVGHVGAFITQKNHDFIVEIINEIKKYDSNLNYKFVFIGDGDLLSHIKEKVNQYQLEDIVLFVGLTDNIEFWLSAFDIFILPSKFEGLPVSVIEAQAANLPCFISDTITRETELSDRITYLPIDQGASIWANHIINCTLDERHNKDVWDKLNNYDVKRTASTIQKEIISY